MGWTTWFVVQPFEATKRGIVPCDPIEVLSADCARKLAERLSDKGGALAFSRSGDMDVGDYEDAVMLGQWGELPPHVEDGVEAA